MGDTARDSGNARPAVPPEYVSAVYDELRALAAHYLRGERDVITLQPTALVNEAYLRIAQGRRVKWVDKTHFLAVAAKQMRRILVQHARHLSAKKRGGRPRRITLQDGLIAANASPVEMLALDEALERLESCNARHARVVELKVFCGMSAAEIAGVVGVTDRTVRTDWRCARAWLARELATTA